MSNENQESQPLLAANNNSASDHETNVAASISNKRLALFACLGITSRVIYFIITPLWMDYFSPTPQKDLINFTTSGYLFTLQPFPSVSPSRTGEDPVFGESTERWTTTGRDSDIATYRTISIYFVMLSQWTASAVVFGAILLIIKIASSGIRRDVEQSYPQLEFVKIGASQAVSSVLCNYSLSGTRTAPYLIAILSNCNVPIQFFVRWLILRKNSSRIKLLCAVAVTAAEFLCMIPTIFPSLQGGSAHEDEGGSTGLGRFLWPLCYVLSQVPFSVANTMTERNVQKTSGSSSIRDGGMTKINIFYFLFWWNLYAALTVLLLFWTDIIPGFGTAHSLSDFIQTMLFDLECLFGGGKNGWACPSTIAALGWLNFLTLVLASLAFAGMMRYSEGSNFTMIIMSIRTPLLFFFWTLFVESPFSFKPHVHLSTWLSIASVCIMLPAIYLYNVDDINEKKKNEQINVDIVNESSSAVIN